MTKDSSHLYSGATSASLVSQRAQDVKDKRGEVTRTREEKQRQLKPHAEAIREVFATEMHRMTHGAYPGEDTMSDEDFRRERQARRRAYESLMKVQGKIMILLREKPTALERQLDAELNELIEDEA